MNKLTQYIGKTVGCRSNKDLDSLGQKDVYLYPLNSNTRDLLMNKKKSPSIKADPYKTANIPTESQVYLWQKIITIVAAVAENFDAKWQQRKRVLSTLLIVLFIFRLVFSKNLNQLILL